MPSFIIPISLFRGDEPVRESAEPCRRGEPPTRHRKLACRAAPRDLDENSARDFSLGNIHVQIELSVSCAASSLAKTAAGLVLGDYFAAVARAQRPPDVEADAAANRAGRAVHQQYIDHAAVVASRNHGG